MLECLHRKHVFAVFKPNASVYKYAHLIAEIKHRKDLGQSSELIPRRQFSPGPNRNGKNPYGVAYNAGQDQP